MSEIDSMVDKARGDLLGLGATIDVVGISDVLNSSYYSEPDSFVSSLFSTDIDSTSINIYLGPATGSAFGASQSVPGAALLLAGELESYSALSHLLGHCLGLYDTNETVFGAEQPDGSNGATAGDLVGDTAADPGLHSWVESNCTLAAAFSDSFPGYDPSPANIMSEGRMACWSAFTGAQRDRVMSVLQSAAVFEEIAVVSAAAYLDVTAESRLLLNTPWFPAVPTNSASFDYDLDGLKDIFVSGHADVAMSPPYSRCLVLRS